MPRRLTALGAEQLMARVVVQASALRREPAVPGTELAVLAAVTQMRLISAAAAAADQQLMAPTERQLPEATAGPALLFPLLLVRARMPAAAVP